MNHESSSRPVIVYSANGANRATAKPRSLLSILSWHHRLTIGLATALLGFALFSASTVKALEVSWHEKPEQLPSTGGLLCKTSTLYGGNEVQLTNVFNAEGEFVVSALSRLDIWVSPLLQIDGDFSQPSNYTPGKGEYLVAWQNGKTRALLTRLKPEHRLKPLAKLVYNTRIVPPGPGVSLQDTELVSVQHNPANLLQAILTSHGMIRKTFNPSAAQQLPACQVVQAHWCGDGVVDAAQGEVCDAGLSNGKPGASCSAQCQPQAQTQP